MNLGSRTFSRRAAMLVGAGALVSVARGGGSDAQEPFPYVRSCLQHPGVQILLDWRAARPVMTIEDLLPPPGWQLYFHPTMPVSFQFPADWRGEARWAEWLSGTLAPVWQTVPPLLPVVTSARIVSPDGAAAFEIGVASITGAALTIQQSAAIALQGVLGESPRVTPICGFEEESPLARTWFQAVRSGTSVLVTDGVTISDSSGFSPFTTLSFQTFLGPSAQFDALARQVFLRILFQLLPGGGGDPTPTPTP